MEGWYPPYLGETALADNLPMSSIGDELISVNLTLRAAR